MDYKDLSDKLLNKKISKRDFIKLAGLYVFCTTVVEPVLNTFSAKVSEVTHSLIDPQKSQEFELSLIFDLFGNLNNNFSFVPGTAHRIHKGIIHPDDKKAASTLEEVGISGIEKLKIVNELFIPNDLTGNFIALGSPSTNALTTAIFEYKQNPEKPEFGFVRTDDPVFEFPFDFYMDGRTLIEQGAVYKRKVFDKLKAGPNWGIRDNTIKGLILPKTDTAGILKNDYLLITVIPNIYEQKGLDTESKIIIFGGAHGTATKAIELLFKNKLILQELVAKTKNIRYWQALLEIDSIWYDPKTQEAHPFELSKSFVVMPISIDEKRILT